MVHQIINHMSSWIFKRYFPTKLKAVWKVSLFRRKFGLPPSG